MHVLYSRGSFFCFFLTEYKYLRASARESLYLFRIEQNTQQEKPCLKNFNTIKVISHHQLHKVRTPH